MKEIFRVESIYKDKTVLIGYFESLEEANKAAHRQGLPGSGQHGKIVRLELFDSFEEFRNTQQNKIRMIAEAKLNEDEKAILKKAWLQELVDSSRAQQ